AGWFDFLDTDEYNINFLKLTYPEHREICYFLGCNSSTVIGKILELIVEKGEATKEELIKELGKNENTVENALEKLVKSEIIEEKEGKYKIHTRLITIKLLHCSNPPPTT
ncbi:MAG: winged helix-turn-helix transcriptional regulator, partial [Candidatus Jordarchaeaceae archaeon]